MRELAQPLIYIQVDMNSAQTVSVQIQPDGPGPFQIRACDECKRQKMKCSSYIDYPDPCKRCQNRRQPCEFTGKPRRTIKRRQKRNQHTKEGKQVGDSVVSSLTFPATEALRKDPIPSDQSFTQDLMLDINNRSEPQTLDRLSEFSVISLPSTTSTADSPIGNLNSRVLQGVKVSPIEINETFSLFFTNYGHHLGSFLDPSLSPDRYFAESPLLFWTIVIIGSRQYMQNPTLLGALAGPVLQLVWESMMQTNEYICPVIESLVLLATWAFPVKTVFKDMTFTLSGMAMSLATQIGFHVPKQAQAFALKTIDSSEITFLKRMSLWTNCVLCRLRSAVSLGYPPTTLELTKKILSVEDLAQYVSSNLVFQLQLLDLAAQASAAVFERVDDAQDNDYLNTTLNMLEANFSNLEIKLAIFQDQERLHFHIARLQIRVYYLGATANDDFLARVVLLYQDSIAVIVLCAKLQESMQLCLSCPTYIWLMLGLAACALLKLLRSSNSALKDSINLSEGRQSYFTAITLLKKTSIEPDDGPGRLAGALTQLWTSRRAHESTDTVGADSSIGRRRPQSRLAMSLFYETLQWYREEYGGQAFLTSLAPREPGLPHSALPTSETAGSQTDNSPLNDDNFQFQLGDIDLEDPLFANWTPMTDDDFTAFSMFPSSYPVI